MKPLKGFVVVNFLLLLKGVHADHTSLCIILPKLYYKSEQYASVGMEKFPQTDLWKPLAERTHGGEMVHDVFSRANLNDFKAGGYPKAQLIIYRIKNQGDYLNGWYRVELRFEGDESKAKMQDALIGMILYVRDDNFRRQHIGEFVHNFPTKTQYHPRSSGNSCPTNDATRFMIISCGGASTAEPLVSNMVVLMRDNKKDGDGNSIWGKDGSKNIIPDLNRNHLNFYVRIPIQDCNQKKSIIFRAKLLLDKDFSQGFSHSDRKVYRQVTTVIFVEQGAIPGIADPLPPPSKANLLKCDEKIEDKVPWYADKGHPIQTGQTPGDHSQYVGVRHIHGCQGSYFIGRCKHAWYDQHASLYSGTVASEARLRHIVNQNEAQSDVAPHCDSWRLQRALPNEGFDFLTFYVKPKNFYDGQTSTIPFKKTNQYLKDTEVKCNITGYNGNPLCNITKKPDLLLRSIVIIDPMAVAKARSRSFSLLGLDEIAGYSKTNITEESKYLGVQFEEGGYTRLVWGLRRGHATIMAIVVFFILPVNLFMTRYYKESFMTQRVLLTRIWYQAHLHGTFFSAALIAASLGVAYAANTYLGDSLTVAGKFHRIVGFISVLLFVALFGLGGFRAYEDPLRKVTIFLHWLFGTILYILMLILMMNAVFIPGSGISSRDQSQLPLAGEGGQGYMSGTFTHVIAWILFEVVVHAIMTGNLIAFDQKMVVVEKRKYFPVPIPIIKEYSSTDALGFGLRVIILYVYIFVALSSTLLYIALIVSTKWKGKGFGPMSCTHNESWAMLEFIPDKCRIP